jgi:succinate-semialdehyde dehydrogenase/glutarate-semialdehyde dehydrogenase
MATHDTINPATGEVIKTYTLHTDQEASDIVDASHTAFQQWRSTEVKSRADIVSRIGDLLRERSDDLATLMATEMGKTRKQAAQEVQLCAAICDYTAENAADMLADEERTLRGGRAVISHQPIGVILGIQPWNFPVYQALRYSVPQLAAGNTVLLKHASNVWGTALELEKLYHDAGVPDDAFRVLLLDDEQTSDLIGHEHVRGVTLTGSPRAGAAVAGKAAEHLKKTVLELGSNDAYLILSDADIDLAVKMCVMGRTYNNGETCVAAKRFVVNENVYDQFRDAFVEGMKRQTTGDPLDDGTKMGPIAREDLREGLHRQVTESIDKGATATIGGELPGGDGFFYPATVLEDVAPGMPAYDEELFGPVASLIKVSSDEEAMQVANDSRFGLGGGIFSQDEERAVELARTQFDTGMVNINGYNLAQPNLPFGGVKDSGYGREHGGYGIKEFVNTKSLMIAQR